MVRGAWTVRKDYGPAGMPTANAVERGAWSVRFTLHGTEVKRVQPQIVSGDAALDRRHAIIGALHLDRGGVGDQQCGLGIARLAERIENLFDAQGQSLGVGQADGEQLELDIGRFEVIALGRFAGHFALVPERQ